MASRPSQQTIRFQRDSGVSISSFVALSLLLVVPACAIGRLATFADWRIVAGLPLAVSLLTYILYWSDKRRAQTGEWRISERTLHMAEAAGGWPGAFLAQRTFRHKISKTSYQAAFWFIVLSHEFVALDFLLDWKLARDVFRFVKSQTA